MSTSKLMVHQQRLKNMQQSKHDEHSYGGRNGTAVTSSLATSSVSKVENSTDANHSSSCKHMIDHKRINNEKNSFQILRDKLTRKMNIDNECTEDDFIGYIEDDLSTVDDHNRSSNGISNSNDRNNPYSIMKDVVTRKEYDAIRDTRDELSKYGKGFMFFLTPAYEKLRANKQREANDKLYEKYKHVPSAVKSKHRYFAKSDGVNTVTTATTANDSVLKGSNQANSKTPIFTNNQSIDTNACSDNEVSNISHDSIIGTVTSTSESASNLKAAVPIKEKLRQKIKSMLDENRTSKYGFSSIVMNVKSKYATSSVGVTADNTSSGGSSTDSEIKQEICSYTDDKLQQMIRAMCTRNNELRISLSLPTRAMSSELLRMTDAASLGSAAFAHEKAGLQKIGCDLHIENEAYSKRISDINYHASNIHSDYTTEDLLTSPDSKLGYIYRNARSGIFTSIN